MWRYRSDRRRYTSSTACAVLYRFHLLFELAVFLVFPGYFFLCLEILGFLQQLRLKRQILRFFCIQRRSRLSPRGEIASQTEPDEHTPNRYSHKIAALLGTQAVPEGRELIFHHRPPVFQSGLFARLFQERLFYPVSRFPKPGGRIPVCRKSLAARPFAPRQRP